MKRELINQAIRKLADKMLSGSQRDTVLRWLIGQQDASEKEEALFRLWNETDTTTVSEEETLKALGEVKAKLHLSDNRRTNIRWVNFAAKYAAIFLLPLITGLVVWGIMENKVTESSEMIECYVPSGEQKTIQLPDGTEVQINSNSLLIYPKEFHGEQRRVHLSGEAFFDVQRNEDMPFVIGTGPLKIRVLGTQFNVESYPEDEYITTILNQGSVKVYHNENESAGIVMKPDEKLIYSNKSNTFELIHTDAKEESSWTQGNIEFNERPLSYILKTLERRYNVHFQYGKDINVDEFYTLEFKQYESIEEVMNVLSILIEGIDYEMKGNNIFLFQKKKKGGIPQ